MSTVGPPRVHTEAGRTGDETHPAVRKLHTPCTRAGHTVSGVPVDWRIGRCPPCDPVGSKPLTEREMANRFARASRSCVYKVSKCKSDWVFFFCIACLVGQVEVNIVSK